MNNQISLEVKAAFCQSSDFASTSVTVIWVINVETCLRSALFDNLYEQLTQNWRSLGVWLTAVLSNSKNSVLLISWGERKWSLRELWITAARFLVWLILTNCEAQKSYWFIWILNRLELPLLCNETDQSILWYFL